MTMNTQLVSGSKLALALAISAVLGACGGGSGGDSSTPATPVATNGSGSTTTSTAGGTTTATNSTPAATTPASTAPSVPATTPAATTPATNSPAATAPAVTAPSNNAQTPSLVNRAMYEQLRRDCTPTFRSFDPATGAACAAGVFVGKDLWDGTTDCTVKLAKDGEVTFTVGDKVRVYKMTQLFRAVYLDHSDQDSPYLFKTHISGYSADDAAKKVHGFIMNVDPTSDGVNLPADFEIMYTYGDVLTSDERTICKFPL